MFCHSYSRRHHCHTLLQVTLGVLGHTGLQTYQQIADLASWLRAVTAELASPVGCFQLLRSWVQAQERVVQNALRNVIVRSSS